MKEKEIYYKIKPSCALKKFFGRSQQVKLNIQLNKLNKPISNIKPISGIQNKPISNIQNPTKPLEQVKNSAK